MTLSELERYLTNYRSQCTDRHKMFPKEIDGIEIVIGTLGSEVGDINLVCDRTGKPRQISFQYGGPERKK
jgi:hypothetical protein